MSDTPINEEENEQEQDEPITLVVDDGYIGQATEILPED